MCFSSVPVFIARPISRRKLEDDERQQESPDNYCYTMLRTLRICRVSKSSTQHSKKSVRPSPGGNYLWLLEGRRCCTCLLRRCHWYASSKHSAISIRSPVWAIQISANIVLVGYAGDRLIGRGNPINSVFRSGTWRKVVPPHHSALTSSEKV